ncbi:hypothetical protein BH10PSE17_BH10PSE17_25250 [soil metagenome]
MQTASIISYALIPLIGWRLYKRFRRMVGRQTSVAWRHWTTVVVFPTILTLLGTFAFRSPLALEALFGGVAAGLILALVGLRLTRFEHTPQGFFYTPNAHIGIALTLLFAGRIAYRFINLATLDGSMPQGMDHADFGRSPWTLLIFGMLAAYYTTYAIGLLRWRLTSKP